MKSLSKITCQTETDHTTWAVDQKEWSPTQILFSWEDKEVRLIFKDRVTFVNLNLHTEVTYYEIKND